MLRQPRKTYAILVPSLVVAFLVSSIGSDKSPSDGGLYYVGSTAWFAFGVLLVATLVFSIVVGIRAVTRR